MKECPVCQIEFDKNTKYCSSECQKKIFGMSQKGKKWDDEKKAALSKKLKMINGSKEVIQKRKITNKERYGGNAPACSKEVQDKMKATTFDRYGVENAMQSDKVKQLTKETMEERYGGFTLQSKDLFDKVKMTNFERYGAENPFESKIVQEKIKLTCLEKYGAENPMQSKEIQDKVKQTCLEKYGVENIRQSFEFKKQLSFSNRNLSYDDHEIFFNNINSLDWWNSQKSFIDVKNELKDQLSLSQIYLYAHQYRPDWEFNSGISSPHQQIINFLDEQQIRYEINTRKVIAPLELDIYIPEHQLAIEVNGVYWHSELQGKDRNYHLNKTIACEAQGIKLLQFWDFEVEQKWSIVKSMILYKMINKTVRKVHGRKCFIRDLTSKEAKAFMESNHLQGFRNGTFYRGLIFEHELIGLLIAGIPRYAKNYDLEIIRFATSLGTQIQGGFSKLIKSLGENKSMISYADRRYSQGQVYEASGWNHLHSSAPSYYYTKDYQTLYHRSAFQKHKLPKLLDSFDPSLTEWENMKLNGYDRIWDCGTKTYFNK